ncbi:MAG: protein phosphatase 2C domain-containing protein [Ignavibacteriaceae bacterium]
MNYKYTSLSKAGNGKKHNEDSIEVVKVDDGILCVVCDGLSNAFAPRQASYMCANIVINYFLNNSSKDYLKNINDAIFEANNSIVDYALSNSESSSMATTADVLFFDGHIIYWGHIGDSRIYDLKNGKLNQLTKDHSLIQQMLDKGYLSMKAAKDHPNKNVILKAVGENQMLEIDMSKLILNPNDKHRFMLCTDGVHDVLKDSEIEKTLRNEELHKCTDIFDRLIQEKGAPDDYSLIIIEKVN